MKKNTCFWISISVGIALIAADLFFAVFSVIKLALFSSGRAVDTGGYMLMSIIFIAVNAAVLITAAGYFVWRVLKAKKE